MKELKQLLKENEKIRQERLVCNTRLRMLFGLRRSEDGKEPIGVCIG